VAKAMTVAPDTTLALRANVDKQLVRSFIAKLANRFNRDPVSSRLLLRSSKPLVTTPVVGRKLDQSAAVAALTDELVHAVRSTIPLQAKLTQPKVTPATIGPVIVIRRGSNRLTLYNGMKVVRMFGVATGQAGYPLRPAASRSSSHGRTRRGMRLARHGRKAEDRSRPDPA